MPIKSWSSRVFAALSLALVIQFAPQLWSNPAFPNPVPGAAVASVRTCIAAINQFTVDGDTGPLWQTLDASGHALDPWPAAGADQRDLVALAFRATYPNLRLSLKQITPSGELFDIEIAEDGGEPVHASPLASIAGEDVIELDMRIAVDPTGVLIRSSAARSHFPLVYQTPETSATFRPPTSGSLLGAELTLQPSRQSERYLSVIGPTLLTPLSATLQLTGMGRLMILATGTDRWRSLGPNERTFIEPGDLLYVASGYATLTMTSTIPARLLYFGIAQADDPGQVAEPEGGRSENIDLTNMLVSTKPPATTWFGSIESVDIHPFEQSPPVMRLEASWIVLPPGGKIELSESQVPSLVTDVSNPSVSVTSLNPSLPIVNRSHQVQILLLLRMTPA